MSKPVSDEELEKAVEQLFGKPKDGDRVYHGSVMSAEGGTASVQPWQRSVTDRLNRIKPNRSVGVVYPRPVVKRSNNARAEDLAMRFVNYLKNKEMVLGRPITPEDLTAEETAALGLDLWKEMGNDLAQKVPGLDFFKRVAAIYLKTEGKVDARWTPSGRGFIKPKPEKWKG